MYFVVQKLFVTLLLCYIAFTSALCQSKAHEYSRFAVIDPAYDSKAVFPKANINTKVSPWIYGPSELECWRLQLLQQRKDSAKLNVGYPGVFHQHYNGGSFKLSLRQPKKIRSINFRAVGGGSVFVNDILIGSFTHTNDIHSLQLNKDITVNHVQFDLKTETDPIALLIEEKELSTAQQGWQWKSADQAWQPASHFAQNLQKLPPHKLEDPTISLKPTRVNNNLYDFGKELFGYIIIKSNSMPTINVGESEKEALDIDNKVKEQSLEIVRVNGNTWKTKVPLAFRYLFIENVKLDDISCEAIFYPARYGGAFACSDSTLTRIWMNSAYTLRLNMHDFLLDGIKRDRLPWTGDLAMSMLVNAYSFADPELVRRSLVALGRAGIKEKDINGIIDYSLWWIIAQDHYQNYFGDTLHLQQEWHRIKETLQHLSQRCDDNGFLMADKGTWLFIDWVKQEKWTALQIMWWWAQHSAVNLAQRVHDPKTADLWTKRSEVLKSNLYKAAWNDAKQIWMSKNDAESDYTRHPNFLAVISGLTPTEQSNGVKNLLEDDNVKPVGTPYMKGFEMIALAQLGNISYMLNNVNDYWGGMLQKGGTTFWEAYDPKETYDQRYAYYGRPYAKSLCHAWSAGPAALLPSEIFGLRPVADGWRHFSVNPQLGNLTWASVCLPTKYGNIIIDLEGKNLQVSIPKGTTMHWNGKAIEGPKEFKDTLLR